MNKSNQRFEENLGKSLVFIITSLPKCLTEHRLKGFFFLFRVLKMRYFQVPE